MDEEKMDDHPLVRDLLEQHAFELEALRDIIEKEESYSEDRHDDIWMLRYLLTHKSISKASAFAISAMNMKFHEEQQLNEFGEIEDKLLVPPSLPPLLGYTDHNQSDRHFDANKKYFTLVSNTDTAQKLDDLDFIWTVNNSFEEEREKAAKLPRSPCPQSPSILKIKKVGAECIQRGAYGTPTTPKKNQWKTGFSVIQNRRASLEDAPALSPNSFSTIRAQRASLEGGAPAPQSGSPFAIRRRRRATVESDPWELGEMLAQTSLDDPLDTTQGPTRKGRVLTYELDMPDPLPLLEQENTLSSGLSDSTENGRGGMIKPRRLGGGRRRNMGMLSKSMSAAASGLSMPL